MPILAGATLRDRLIACLGTVFGLGLTALICGRFLDDDPATPLLLAPLGASAVLLFAIPASPLAQPWPIIGGNSLSAAVGLLMAALVREPLLAASLAVTLALAVMTFTRSLHPPGGAMALIAALGGPDIVPYGNLLPLLPIALDSLVLVLFGVLFHRLTRRPYPHRAAAAMPEGPRTLDPPPRLRSGLRPEDLDAALKTLGTTFDIDRQDLERLLRQVEQQALLRSRGELRCRDIMSRDLVKIGPAGTSEQARALLLAHNIRTLPVADDQGRLLGTVGLRELAAGGTRIETLLAKAATAAPDDPAVGLVPTLSDGRSHAVVVVDNDRRILGLITQTDLLATLARPAIERAPS